ncbi:MAG: hypothetical protein O3A01_06360 [bacterium]|nr:hypothetical protein [bacterium]
MIFFFRSLAFWVLVSVVVASGLGFNLPCYADELTKMGRLSGDEIWRGQVRLVGDVVVPKGVTLHIAPDTILLFEQVDLKNLGTDNARVELIAEGLILREKPYTIREFDVYRLDGAHNAVEFTPKRVDTSPLTEEFREFRYWYSPLWFAIAYGIVKAYQETRIGD